MSGQPGLLALYEESKNAGELFSLEEKQCNKVEFGLLEHGHDIWLLRRGRAMTEEALAASAERITWTQER